MITHWLHRLIGRLLELFVLLSFSPLDFDSFQCEENCLKKRLENCGGLSVQSSRGYVIS